MDNTFIPLQSSRLGLVEAPFLNPGKSQYEVAVGLGASSRGQCLQRNFNTGLCWGTFEAEDTKFVNNRDHDISAMLEENIINGMASGIAANSQNNLAQLSGQQKNSFLMGYTGEPYVAYKGTLNCKSYGNYNSCPNCSLTYSYNSC